MLQGMGPMGPVNVKVVEVKEETVVLDANHPLAGKKLIFDLEVVSIS
jgi:FKBP-type peptidyl-prolyl cis-trans isomerase 2